MEGVQRRSRPFLRQGALGCGRIDDDVLDEQEPHHRHDLSYALDALRDERSECEKPLVAGLEVACGCEPRFFEPGEHARHESIRPHIPDVDAVHPLELLEVEDGRAL